MLVSSRHFHGSLGADGGFWLVCHLLPGFTIQGSAETPIVTIVTIPGEGTGVRQQVRKLELMDALLPRGTWDSLVQCPKISPKMTLCVLQPLMGPQIPLSPNSPTLLKSCQRRSGLT